MYNKIVLLLCLSFSSVKGSNMCNKKNSSCTHQLWNNGGNDNKLAGDFCRMTYYKSNSALCASLKFLYNTETQRHMGDVHLKAYSAEEVKQTLFNVTFTNIRWKKALMRFSKIGSENEKNTCRMFNVWENVSISRSSTLSFDCPWSKVDYEGTDFSFEYEFGVEEVTYKKVVFKVPSFKSFNATTKVQHLQIFTYLDVTDTEYLQLHIQLANPKYNITSYLVEVIRERSSISTRLTVQILNAKDAIDGELVFRYPTWNEFGHFYFNVSPINNVCKENQCVKSSTPIHFLGRKKSSLVIGIVGASVILFALFYAMFFWNRKKNIKENIQPRVLLVYNSTISSHCNVVRNLEKLLHELLHIEVLLDVLDIQLTEHKDPLLWCDRAFTYATHIIYIASPEISTTKKAKSESIYKIYGASLKFIKRELNCAHSTKQMLTITFPYSVNSVPNELSSIRRFNLMKDMDTFISALVTPPYQSWTFLQIYRPNRFRGEPQYLEFMASIYAAQREIDLLTECITSQNNLGPKIMITENSLDNSLAADSGSEDNDNDILLRTDDNGSFPISEMNFTGEPSENSQDAEVLSRND